ncbi:AzlC family ABC transporter permease [Saccharibacillus sacchari]|uniref:AzlC family ABC transporter permease n=1 Tax=Saccharibacillus sacchari TaxID=456493 RepID=A0ACC6PEF6_9BACL
MDAKEIAFEKDRGTREETVNTFVQGIKDCLPTLFGYISIGLAFGIVGAASNLNFIEVTLLSWVVYAGSSQFIICALIAAGTPMLSIVLTTFIVNLRHLLLSLTLAPYFTKYSLWKNIGIGALLTDESFGIASVKAMQEKRLGDRWMNGLNLTAYIGWSLSCMAGSLFGRWIADAEALGLDFALVAMFIALLVLQLQQIPAGKLRGYILLILLTGVLMAVLSQFMAGHTAVLISTVIAASVGTVIIK